MLRRILTVWLLAMGWVSYAALADDDAHYIQSDDYFIGERQLGQETYMYVKLAKMITSPSAATKGDGEFMQVGDGKNRWTKHIWRSRIADASELKLGQHIIAFHDHAPGGIYQAPPRKEAARGHTWWYAKITDLTDTYKGFVTVSGNYKVALKNIRIPIPFASSEAATSVAPMPAAKPATVAPPEPPPVAVAPAAAPEPALAWNGGDWVEVRFGGCDLPNVRHSKVAVPDPDYCDARMNGKVVVCNADHGGCFYKNVTPKQCKDGSRPGRMFVCTPK